MYIRFDQLTTDYLCNISPEHCKAVREDGSSIVQLNKALYECIESSMLWGEDLTKTMSENGFTVRNE